MTHAPDEDATEDRPATKPNGLSILARVWPFALTLVVFAFLFWKIPFDRFWEALERASMLPFVATMSAFALTFFAMDTFVLTKMVRWFHGPVRYRDLLPLRAATYVVAIVNTQLAQGAMALFINKRFGTPLAAVGGTVGVIILLEVTQLVLWATIGIVANPGRAPLQLLVTPAVIVALWATLIIIARGGLGSFGAKIREHALFATFAASGPKHWGTILGLKGLVFLLSIGVHGFALTLFGIHVPLLDLLSFLPIIYFVSALPVTVAHLGTSQLAWVYFIGDYAPEADILAYSLAAHLTFMLANGAAGLICLPKLYGDINAASLQAAEG